MAKKPKKPATKKAPKKPTRRKNNQVVILSYCSNFGMAVFDITIDEDVLGTQSKLTFRGQVCMCPDKSGNPKSLKITSERKDPCEGKTPCS